MVKTCNTSRGRQLEAKVEAKIASAFAYGEALLREGIDTMLAGDVDADKALLRDYIEAAVGFGKLGEATGTQPKSFIRMFGPRANPKARNLFVIIGSLHRSRPETALVPVTSVRGHGAGNFCHSRLFCYGLGALILVLLLALPRTKRNTRSLVCPNRSVPLKGLRHRFGIGRMYSNPGNQKRVRKGTASGRWVSTELPQSFASQMSPRRCAKPSHARPKRA
jgi:hypothetical protein